MNQLTLVEDYLKALQYLDPIQRDAFLDSACSGDTALRGKVEELLDE